MVFQKSDTRLKICEIKEIKKMKQNFVGIAANLYDTKWQWELKRGTMTHVHMYKGISENRVLSPLLSKTPTSKWKLRGGLP